MAEQIEVGGVPVILLGQFVTLDTSADPLTVQPGEPLGEEGCSALGALLAANGAAVMHHQSEKDKNGQDDPTDVQQLPFGGREGDDDDPREHQSASPGEGPAGPLQLGDLLLDLVPALAVRPDHQLTGRRRVAHGG